MNAILLVAGATAPVRLASRGGLSLGYLNLGKDIAEPDQFSFLGLFDLDVHFVALNEGIKNTRFDLLVAGNVTNRLPNHIFKSSLE